MNLSSFPLYSNIKSSAKDDALTPEEKLELITTLKRIDTETSEIIYALIRCFYLETTGGLDGKTLPYDGKVLKNVFKWELDKLPSKLENILLEFSRRHKMHTEEQKHLQKSLKKKKSSKEHVET